MGKKGLEPEKKSEDGWYNDPFMSLKDKLQFVVDNLVKFENIDREKQTEVLGEILFKIIYRKDQLNCARITYIICDLENKSVGHILNVIGDEKLLDYEIKQAMDIIQTENEEYR